MSEIKNAIPAADSAEMPNQGGTAEEKWKSEFARLSKLIQAGEGTKNYHSVFAKDSQGDSIFKKLVELYLTNQASQEQLTKTVQEIMPLVKNNPYQQAQRITEAVIKQAEEAKKKQQIIKKELPENYENVDLKA